MSNPATLAFPRPTLTPERSIVPVPTVIAHRGDSGHRPEHTLGAYRAAVVSGADGIEVDLVVTSDGVLVARHENELSHSTDVAVRPEFAERRTTRLVDGVPVTGWFCDDFTFAEVKQLGAVETMPHVRSHNTVHDGTEGVPSLTEVLAMVGAETVRRGAPVQVLLELKHPSHLASRGLDLVEPLLTELRRHGLDHPLSGVTVMAFETTVLRRLAELTRLPLVQLVDHRLARPYDLVLAGDRRTYADLMTPAGLDWIDEYADGLGVAKDWVMPRDAAGRTTTPSGLVAAAHARDLTVHVWTLRAENGFLPTNHRVAGDRAAIGDVEGEVRAHLAAGVDGVITDHPARCSAAVRLALASAFEAGPPTHR